MEQSYTFRKDDTILVQYQEMGEEEANKLMNVAALIAEPEIDRHTEKYQKEWIETRDAVISKAEELDEADRGRLRGIFDEFFPIMRLKHEPPGLVKSYEVEIKLTKYDPIYIRPYAMSDVVLVEIDRQLTVMLKHSIIGPSISEWNFPIVAVKKKLLDLQKDQIQEIRMCIDYRELNKITEAMTWPIPAVDATLHRLGGAKFFTTLDILSGFWNLPIKKEHRKFLAFATKFAHYEFNRMPFGWNNSPFHFQRYMQTRIADRHKDCCQVYIDDIVIYSNTKEEHFEHIRKVLATLQEEGLFLKMMKIHTFQPQLEYLGHIIARDGIRKDPKKLTPLAKVKAPVNKKQVRQFLGKINYYSKFMAHLAFYARLLARLTSQSDEVPFEWGEAEQAAFEHLKRAVMEDVVLAYPDPNKPFNITADASDYALGAVLSQTDEETKLERPIMFISTTLSPTERRYTTTEKELYAIVFALDKFRPYIYGRKFNVYTDHRALIWLCGKKNPMSRLGRWSIAIAEYSQGIHFIAGKNNRVADALSRAPFVDEPPPTGMDEYQSNGCIPQNIKDQVAKMAGIDPEEMKEDEEMKWSELLDTDVPKHTLNWDPQAKGKRRTVGTIATTITKPKDQWQPVMLPKYWAEHVKLKEIPTGVKPDREGILWAEGTDIHGKKSRVLWVPPAFRREVLRAFHCTPLSAHPSHRKMYLRMAKQVCWYGMAKEVKDFVKNCHICQKNRFGLREKPTLQSRGAPTRPMQRISMDLLSLEGVRAPGPSNVLVIVDEFTRYAEVFPVKNMESDTIADKLVEEFICRYGIPEEILTDRGANFLSDLFVELCRQLKIQKLNTTAYHPEGNGANERMHGTLYTILRASTNRRGQDWKRQLPIAMFVYRNTVHKSIGISPHQALYGFTSRHECLDEGLNESTYNLDDRVKALYEMREHIQARMEQIERENRVRNNAKRTLRCYEPGEQVLLRNHVRHKLDTPWRGPYTIVNRVSNVNYEIQLPSGDRTYKVVHTQHLRPWSKPLDEDEMPELVEPQDLEEHRGRADRKLSGGDIREVEWEESRPMTRAYARQLRRESESKLSIEGSQSAVQIE